MIDRSKLSYYGGDKIDQVIGIHTGTINVGAATISPGWNSASDTFNHEFDDSAYFEGIFSIDGGTTWNDFGSQIPNTSGLYPDFQTCDCNATVTTSGLIVKATSWYQPGHDTSSAYAVLYKVFLIAKNTMAKPINPLSTNEKLSLNGVINTQKIAFQDTAPISVASNSTGSVTVTHNLGYVPKVRAWFFKSDSPTTCRPITADLTSLNYTDIEVKIDESNVTFYVDASDFHSSTVGNIEYRIYYDD